MSLKHTLERVEQEASAGDYGKARDRLHGLLVTYPDNLDLRRRLGEVYASLHDPAMAGRYWYLEENKSPAMAAACQSFERSCGGVSAQILRSLKFRGSVDAIRDTFAARTLLALQDEARGQTGSTFDLSGRVTKQWSLSRSRSSVCLVGVMLAGVVILALAAVGLYAVYRWVFWPGL